MNPTFLLFCCDACDRETLAHCVGQDDDTGEMSWACTQCDAPKPPEAQSRWVELEELGELGFLMDGQDITPPEASGERGCRGGACGVQQEV